MVGKSSKTLIMPQLRSFQCKRLRKWPPKSTMPLS
jgi:hypothetical protein